MANLRGQGAPSTLKASAGSTYTDLSTFTVYTNAGTFGSPNWKVDLLAPTRVLFSSGAISGSTTTAFSASTEAAVLVITGATITGGAVNSYIWYNSLISTDSVVLGSVSYAGTGNAYFVNTSLSGGSATIRIGNASTGTTTSGNINVGLRVI